MTLNKPAYIIIHCSDSAYGDVALIDEWHKARGFERPERLSLPKHVGYHYIITSARTGPGKHREPDEDGRIHPCREHHENGAHARGYNEVSIGICLIGNKETGFSAAQFASMLALTYQLQLAYDIPDEHVLGHYEVNEDKTCPELDMDHVRNALTGLDMVVEYHNVLNGGDDE